jgi:tetratricopeptide (TPR) repeat protein
MRLAEKGEADLLRTRHAAWLLALAGEAETALQSPRQAEWYDRLQAEHENLRAGLEWCASDADLGITGMGIIAGISRFWLVRGYFTEGSHRTRAALLHPGAQGLSIERTKALNVLAGTAWAVGDYRSAREALERAATDAAALNDPNLSAIVLNNLGTILEHLGDFERAEELYEQALALNRAIGNTVRVGANLGNLGSMKLYRGELGRARRYLEESLAIFRETGERTWQANNLHTRARICEEVGDYAGAVRLSEQALAINRELGNVNWESHNLHMLGNAARHAGDLAEALRQYARALVIISDLGVRIETAANIREMASIAAAENRAARAARLWGAADRLSENEAAHRLAGERRRSGLEIAATRSSMGDAAFDAAWREGRAMTMEQAVALALAEPEEG